MNFCPKIVLIFIDPVCSNRATLCSKVQEKKWHPLAHPFSTFYAKYNTLELYLLRPMRRTLSQTIETMTICHPNSTGFNQDSWMFLIAYRRTVWRHR